MAKNAVSKVEEKQVLPAHLQGGKTTKIGNVDSSDLIIPRIKLLQAVSPEVTENDDAKAGNFWHTVMSENLGAEITIIPILVQKSYMLWAPRGDDRGVLSRAMDAIHWDVKEEFEVKPKGSSAKVKWDTREGTVAGSGLDKFGTSIPGDSNSAPAATLTYNLLAHLPDHPDLSPALFLFSRSSVKPAKMLLSKIDGAPVDHYGLKFKIKPVKQSSSEGEFFNYAFVQDGFVTDEVQFSDCKALFERFSKTSFRASDEGEDEGDKPTPDTKKF